MSRLKSLWRGQLPLETAFWHYTIYWGLIINLAATTISVVLLLSDASVALAVAVHLLPVPYSVLTIFGVWRSARYHRGQGGFATFARVGVLAWSCLWLAL
jgi:hypothetical protein